MEVVKWMEIEARRNETIEKAVQVAERIILDGSDGSKKEVAYLTAEVTRKFVAKSLYPFYQAILQKDMKKSENGGS